MQLRLLKTETKILISRLRLFQTEINISTVSVTCNLTCHGSITGKLDYVVPGLINR